MERLLTKEERQPFLVGDGYATDTTGLCKAQDTKTLKAVGEWLERVIPPNEFEKVISPDKSWTWHQVIEVLLNGEMPEDLSKE